MSGLMGALGAGGTLGMGIGALNGVIQTPGGPHATGAATLTVNNRYVCQYSFELQKKKKKKCNTSQSAKGLIIAFFIRRKMKTAVLPKTLFADFKTIFE